MAYDVDLFYLLRGDEKVMTELKRGARKDFKLPIPILFLVRSKYTFFAHEKRGRSDTEMTSQIWSNLAIMKHKKPKLRKI